MKTFTIILRDGRTVTKRAETYTKDADQYIFHGAEAEVEFFNSSDVVSITIAEPMSSFSMLPPRQPRDESAILPGADAGE